MPKITIDGREIELPDGLRINAIEAAKRAGVEIPHYCYHPGLLGRGKLPHVPDRDGQSRRQDGRDQDAAQARARLHRAGRRRPGDRHRQRESAASAGDGRRRPAPAAPGRLPHLRQGGRMSVAGLLLQVRPGAAGGPTCRPFTSRKRDLGDVELVHRPLRDVLALRALLRRGQRHGRTDGRQPRRPGGNRRRARFPAAQRAVGQRGRSLPRRRAGRQGLPLSAASLVHAAASGRLHRLLAPAARSGSRRTRTISIASSPARIRK